jgi:dTDP-4-dehydrorhamnose reductase
LIDRSLIVGASSQVGNQLALALGDAAIRSARIPRAEDWKAVEIVENYKLDAIYCVGGATDVERCESEPKWAMNTNFHGPVALAKAATHIPFIYYSTEYIFDGADGPYTEESIAAPISIYGKSKWYAEQEILRVHPCALIIRTTVVYGSDPGEKNFLYSLRKILGSNRAMRVPVDQISTPTYNQDLATASLQLIHAGATGIFNVCGPELLSRYDFAVQAARIIGLDSSLIVGVRTTELNQSAPRPLNAGLLIGKLRTYLPSVSMHCVQTAIAEWMTCLSGESK